MSACQPTHLAVNNVNNVYGDPSTDHPRDTQVVMGEEVQVTGERVVDFVPILMPDGYTGWIREARLRPFEELPSMPEADVTVLTAFVLRQPRKGSALIT